MSYLPQHVKTDMLTRGLYFGRKRIIPVSRLADEVLPTGYSYHNQAS